jgi:hypothetical protein
MSRYIVEHCTDESNTGLDWIVWDIQTNTSPSGWLESKEEAEQFIKQTEEV